tara:strand:- start:217 stop:423 length:207 start_codon:yes stop_codon:yes gene_type:complete
VVAVREDFVLPWQVGAAGVHQVDAGQAVDALSGEQFASGDVALLVGGAAAPSVILWVLAELFALADVG